MSDNRLSAGEARFLLGPGAARRARAKRIDGHLELISGLERLARPTLANQSARARALKVPYRWAAVGTLHFEKHKGVRARELELLHRALQLHRVLLIEHRKGMMSPSGAACDHAARRHSQPQQLTLHSCPP